MSRIAIVKREDCAPNSCAYLCVKLCPVNRTKQDCIIKKEKITINEDLCTGCGICQNRCPFQAIQIVNLPEKLENPIHRYGANQFELFNLPTIKKNKIIGIIGRNGIGKSTSLQILTNSIKPNLGNLETQPDNKEIINKYSNTYLANYFKNLFSNKIKVSYKPQRVELLAKLYKNKKVIDLIKKIDEKKQGENLLKQLDIENIKNRKINELSGGELQRLAIIAAIIKKAEIYYFDEPTSFLDITHRIKAANIIKKLAKNATVIVIEHDLATLDYISDEIQIIYGEPAAYGIISQPKAIRRGINEYLDGYLPEDNVRFRNYSIKFQKSPKERPKSKDILFSFPELEKSYKTFKLKTSKGDIYKQEVLCVMGSNGLGKTTFLKLLAGIEKPDKGEIQKQTISYKPQYLEILPGTVLQNLQKAAKEKLNSGWFKQNILEKLGLNRILNQETKNLSGGELQKLHIALTLSKDAKILAFDEPSAFIDVEDRLKVAEIIKEFTQKQEICAIVVDHDIQFIDYLADSMLVFEGTPAKTGIINEPCSKKQGMNKILKQLNITYRKDKETNRPRINKPNSQLDTQQKNKGEYYYTS